MAANPFWTDEKIIKKWLYEVRHTGFTGKSPGKIIDDAMLYWTKNNKHDLSLLASKDEKTEKSIEKARSFIRERMCFLEELHSVPLDVQIISEEEREGYNIQNIKFTGTPPLRVPAIVLIPKGKSGPFPAIVALHDRGSLLLFGKEKLLAFEGEPEWLTQHRIGGYDGKSIMSELAKRGYIVISIDALNFGERTIECVEDPEGFKKRRLKLSTKEMREKTTIICQDDILLLRNAEIAGMTWPGIYTMDDIRTVDYLCQRDDVIKESIGCIGLSVGGFRTNHLAALDTRIKAAVSVGWTSTIDGIVGYNVGGAIGWFMLTQGLFRRLDIPDVQSLAIPRAFMAISGWNDHLFQPFGIAKAHLHLRKCYEKAGCPEQLGSMIYDSPHEFNSAMQKDAFDFLSAKL